MIGDYEQSDVSKPMLKGFLSDYESKERIVSITTEPEIIYFEEARNSLNLNFDFVITGLTERKLVIREQLHYTLICIIN